MGRWTQTRWFQYISPPHPLHFVPWGYDYGLCLREAVTTLSFFSLCSDLDWHDKQHSSAACYQNNDLQKQHLPSALSKKWNKNFASVLAGKQKATTLSLNQAKQFVHEVDQPVEFHSTKTINNPTGIRFSPFCASESSSITPGSPRHLGVVNKAFQPPHPWVFLSLCLGRCLSGNTDLLMSLLPGHHVLPVLHQLPYQHLKLVTVAEQMVKDGYCKNRYLPFIFIITIKVFIKCKILSIETILSEYTHTNRHLHTRAYWLFRT